MIGVIHIIIMTDDIHCSNSVVIPSYWLRLWRSISTHVASASSTRRTTPTSEHARRSVPRPIGAYFFSSSGSAPVLYRTACQSV